MAGNGQKNLYMLITVTVVMVATVFTSTHISSHIFLTVAPVNRALPAMHGNVRLCRGEGYFPVCVGGFAKMIFLAYR
jgi:hypothetical protein